MLRMIKRVLAIAGKQKPRILLGILFNLLRTGCMALLLFAVYVVFAHLDRLDGAVIKQALLILLGSVLGRFLFQWLSDIAMSAQGFEMFRDYRLAVGDKLKGAPMGYFSEQRLGVIQTILTSTVVQLEQYSMMAISDITGGVFMAAVLTIVMAFFNWPIALLSLAGLISGVALLRVIQKRAETYAPKVQKAEERLVADSLEYIKGIAVLRAFSQGEANTGAVYHAFDVRRQAAYAQEQAAAGVMKLYSLVFKLAGCGILFLSVALYLAHAFPLSYCLMFLVSAFLIYLELETMGDGAFLAKKINNELDRLETVTNIPSLDRTDRELHATSLDIELKDVSFAYDSRKILDHVSLKISQGSTCAIVGPSGSGKTTLCNLIARFWDVEEGKVLVGGQEVKDITSDSLLRQISMVFQNVYLFHDTLANNIKFGKPDATHAEVVEAAKRARCDAFISNLPNGYDTVVGEGGSTLSGGEKQRVSIARAILKDAPIVILDEATSSVDPENEYTLLAAIRELTKGKTLISIAHRLNTVRDADQIIVLDSGHIVQHGTHTELVNQPGVYQNFLRRRSESIGWKL